MLTTDDRASFAILVYDNPEQVVSITLHHSGIGMIGFDAGDFGRSTTLLSSEERTFSLESSNVFRIDGTLKTHRKGT